MKSDYKATVHKPVLLKESIDILNVTKDGNYIDCTLGGGGHTLEIASRMQLANLVGHILALDVDKDAIERFVQRLVLEGWTQRSNDFAKKRITITPINENFDQLTKCLVARGISGIEGCIADLGASSDQLEESSRGFSYMKDAPLDMRMDKRLALTASDIVNAVSEKELERIFRESDEPYAKRIAALIIRERGVRRIERTLHLTNIIKQALPSRRRKELRSNRADVGPYWKKPAMRVFQALRIAVNLELSSLQKLLPQALEALAVGARFVVISFHSGEDRIIKRFMKEKEQRGEVKILTQEITMPTREEISRNPRARSAKLRAFEKLKIN